jgi:hypothetical protein
MAYAVRHIRIEFAQLWTLCVIVLENQAQLKFVPLDISVICLDFHLSDPT